MSVKGHSTKIEVGDEATHADSETWTPLFTKVTELTPPKIEAEDIDVTHMESPEQFDEFDPGHANGGEVEMTAQYEKTQQETVYGLFRTPRGFRMVFVDGSRWVWSGYIKALSNETEKRGIVTVKLTIKVSGKPVFEKTAPVTP